MTSDRYKAFNGWCCVDCLMLLANGETDPDWSESERTEYLACVERYSAGTEVTLGMFREDHPCRVNFTVTYAPTRYSRRRLTMEILADDIADARDVAFWQLPAGGRVVGYPRRHNLATMSDLGGECECEQNTFSWSQCDVCGSGLGGARHAVVFWPQPDTRPIPLASTEPVTAPDTTENRLIQAVSERFSAIADEPAVPAIDTSFGAGCLHTNPRVTCPACAANPGITRSDHFGILAMAASLAADRIAADNADLPDDRKIHEQEMPTTP